MNTIQKTTVFFLILVGIAFLSVSIKAFIDPQSVMDFVNVKLSNISARNSIRAYYGGVNLTFALFSIYGSFKYQREVLLLIILYGGGFVLGRLYSIFNDGVPSEFIFKWLIIESILTIISVVLFIKAER